MVPTFRPRAALTLLRHVVENSTFAPPVPSDAALAAMGGPEFDGFLDKWVAAAAGPDYVGNGQAVTAPVAGHARPREVTWGVSRRHFSCQMMRELCYNTQACAPSRRPSRKAWRKGHRFKPHGKTPTHLF